MKKGIIIVLTLSVLAALGRVSTAATPGEKEGFTARVLQGGMQYSEGVRKIKITIDGYSTEEEVLNLIGVMGQQGYEPFMDAFRALNKGIFFPIGGRGIKIIIHGAHSIPTEKGRKIQLFTTRQTWDVESNQRVDSRFTFMVIELDLDAKGKGTGKIYEQAAIRMTPQRTFEMDGYNSPPKQLFDVRPAK
jgi:hypothetical protein